MPSLLDFCGEATPLEIAPATYLLREGERSGQLYVLVEGTLEVRRRDVEVAIVTEPGAVFGEMSVLLDQPHTADVIALSPSKVQRIDNASAFLAANPGALRPISTLLARRLRNATTYLANLKHQFSDQADHFGMIDEVLESLTHQQGESFPPADELPTEP